jgi:hypothetical protein
MVIYVSEGTIWEPRSLCRTESHHAVNDKGRRFSAVASTSSPAWPRSKVPRTAGWMTPFGTWETPSGANMARVL